MTEENKGNNPPKENPNPIAGMHDKDLAYRVVELEKANKALQEKLVKVESERDAANKTIASDIRARKIDEILDGSNYTVEDMDDKSLEELDAIAATLKMAKKPIKSVGDYGVHGEPEPQRALDDLYGQGWMKNKK